MRYLWIVVGVGLALPSALQAQRGSDMCGIAARQVTLIELGEQFTSAQGAAWRRQRHVAVVPASAPHRIVTDEKACNKILTAGVKYLNTVMSQKVRGKTFVHAIYQFGPYYVLLLMDPPGDLSDPRKHPLSMDPSFVVILDGTDLDVVSWYLW